LGAALLGAPVANAQFIGAIVQDDGVTIGTIPLTPGGVAVGVFSDGNFSNVTVTATGNPLTPFPDFGTVSTDISTNFLDGPHTLTILATQIGVVPTGTSEAFQSSFTTNNLVGGALVQSVNFGNWVDAADGPFILNQNIGATTFLGTGALTGVGGLASVSGLFSETMVMSAVFGGGVSQIQTTDQITGVPEPGTWAMMLLGFVGLGFMFHKRRKSAQLPALA
jgi:hypothetical protein